MCHLKDKFINSVVIDLKLIYFNIEINARLIIKEFIRNKWINDSLIALRSVIQIYSLLNL